MSQSLQASETGLAIADRARKRLGWTKTSTACWWQDAHTSRATLRRFWRGERIQQTAFIAICAAVGITDWQKIAAEPDIDAIAPPELTNEPIWDWDEAPDVTTFYGRSQTLEQLTTWIRVEQTRVIVITGVGGVGKTALALAIAEQVQSQCNQQANQPFEVFIWRSLEPEDTIAGILGSLTNDFYDDWREGQQPLLTKLQQRCFIVLDGWESNLGQQDTFLRWLGKQRHHSCVLVTRRPRFSVQRSSRLQEWVLSGLADRDAIALLQTSGYMGSDRQCVFLAQQYRGNPLALKLVASLIQTMFGGDMGAFLDQEVLVVGDLAAILAQSVSNLTPLDRDLLYWLAIWRKPIALCRLQTHLYPTPRSGELLTRLAALVQWALVEQCHEQDEPSFGLPPLLLEFVEIQLVEHAIAELTDFTQTNNPRALQLWRSHALLRPGTDDLARDRILKQIHQGVQQQGSSVTSWPEDWETLRQSGAIGYLQFNWAAYLTFMGRA